MKGFLRDAALTVLLPLSSLMLRLANALSRFTLNLWREQTASKTDRRPD